MNRVDVCKLAIDKRFLKLTFQTLALRQSALMKSYCRNVIFRISCFPLLQYHSFLRNLLPTYFLMLIFVIIGRMYYLFISTGFYIEFSLPVTPVTHPICTQKAQTFQGPLAILLEFQCKSIRDFRHLHLNTQSMVSTFNEFLLTVTNHTLDIITLSETWLKDHPLLMEYVAIPGFNTEFRSRDTIRGGGVGAYIKDTIKYKRRHDIENLLPELEHLWIEVPGRNRHSKALVGVIYRSRRVLDAS